VPKLESEKRPELLAIVTPSIQVIFDQPCTCRAKILALIALGDKTDSICS